VKYAGGARRYSVPAARQAVARQAGRCGPNEYMSHPGVVQAGIVKRSPRGRRRSPAQNGGRRAGVRSSRRRGRQ